MPATPFLLLICLCCYEGMSTASKNLGDCFHDLYEPEWARQAEVSQALNVSTKYAVCMYEYVDEL